MNKKVLAVAAAATMGLGGCGEKPSGADSKPHTADAAETRLGRTSMDYIVKRDAAVLGSDSRFQNFQSNTFTLADTYNLAQSGVPKKVHVYADVQDSTVVAEEATSYPIALSYFAKVAEQQPTARLPLYRFGVDGVHRMARVLSIELAQTPGDAQLVVSQQGTVRRPKATARNGAAPEYYGVTFSPYTLDGLERSVSFVRPTKEKRTLGTALALSVEACQAAVRVETGSEDTDLAAQEVYCNAAGLALTYASGGRNYAEYKRAADFNKVKVASESGQHFVPSMTLDQSVYRAMQNAQPVDITQGIRVSQ
jgi:hypothetical protein